MDFGQLASLPAHSFGVRASDFSADGALNNFTNFHNPLPEVCAFFGDQRGIGGHSVEETEGCALANFIQIGCVQEYFHRSPLSGKAPVKDHRVIISPCVFADELLSRGRAMTTAQRTLRRAVGRRKPPNPLTVFRRRPPRTAGFRSRSSPEPSHGRSIRAAVRPKGQRR